MIIRAVKYWSWTVCRDIHRVSVCKKSLEDRWPELIFHPECFACRLMGHVLAHATRIIHTTHLCSMGLSLLKKIVPFGYLAGLRKSGCLLPGIEAKVTMKIDM